MKTILPVAITLVPDQRLLLPAGAEVLSVTADDGDICLNVLADLSEPTIENRILVIPDHGQIGDTLLAIFVCSFRPIPHGAFYHLFLTD